MGAVNHNERVASVFAFFFLVLKGRQNIAFVKAF